MKNEIINTIYVNSNNPLQGKGVINVVTHSGMFHADELIAIVLIQIANPKKTINVIRTRNDDRIQQLKDTQQESFESPVMNIMFVDVGREYDAQLLRFDHHQNDFESHWPADEGVSEFKFKGPLMASAGLVYDYYLYNLDKRDMFSYIDPSIIKSIDMNDNGLDPSDENPFDNSLSEIVGKLNVGFGDDVMSSDDVFADVANFLFRYMINHIMRNKKHENALEIISKAERLSDEGIGAKTLILSEGCSWKNIIHGESEKYGDVENVIYPKRISENYTTYNVQKPSDKAGKKAFSSAPYHETPKVKAMFVHKNGFIANLRTLDDAKNFILNQ